MVHYSHCPVCKKESIARALSAEDYTVSHQRFEIWHCGSCSARFTQDIPGQEAIGAFYASENYISHSDTKEGLVNRLYHAVRKRTLRSKMQLVKRETAMQQGALLDIGCGTGAFLDTMQHAGWQITGLEPDEQARERAAALYNIKAQEPGILFHLAPGSFDAITMWHVLEHVHDLHGYVAQLKKLLSERGRIFIAVPNYTSYDASVYKEHWAAYDVPRHLYHFSPQSMHILMQMHGLKVNAVHPMWFDSFYVSMLSEQYINKGRGNLARAAIKGLVSNSKTLFSKNKCSSVIYVISA